MAFDRRTVYFNLDDVIEKEMYELSGSPADSFDHSIVIQRF